MTFVIRVLLAVSIFLVALKAVGESRAAPGLMLGSDAMPIDATSPSSALAQCRANLETLPVRERLRELSVNRSFNQIHGRSVMGLSGPRERTVTELEGLELTGECLGHMPFEFKVFDSGELRRGANSDLRPIHLWRQGGGYFVVYAYKKYEQEDGEGEALVLSLVTFDALGRFNGVVEEVSSWYEYEGFVRTRDSRLTGEMIEVIEAVFDSTVRHAFGQMVGADSGSEVRVIRKYAFRQGKYE